MAIYGAFISQKINKIRWKPDLEAEAFITGSWDDEENQIKLWKYLKNEDELVKPKLQCSASVWGDVTELKFIERNFFLVSTTRGSIQLYCIEECNGASVFKLKNTWNNLHFYPHTKETCAVADFAFLADTIISVGEDGKIALMRANEAKPYKFLQEADSRTFRCISFNKIDEVLTGNSNGHLKIWDLRSNSSKPETSYSPSESLIGFTRIVHHPSQTHIKILGDEDGNITVWDSRNGKDALNSLAAHSQAVNELMFHPERPEHLFTCSADGQVWHWDSTTLSRNQSHIFSSMDTSTYADMVQEAGCPWMSKNFKNRVTIFSLVENVRLPVNSLDVSQNSLICGCDNEAVYLKKDFVERNFSK